jgi:hypothetical protein
MSCAIRLDRQAGQQQTQNDTENQLFLLRQPIHLPNIAENETNSNNAIYDLTSAPYDWPVVDAWEFARKSSILNRK